MKPILSIIIPVFNRQKSFDRLCKSLERNMNILGQEAQSVVEIIVVDDGSRHKLAINHLFANIKLFRHSTNQGAPISRKTGFDVSQGRFIHFHDSDDSFPENWLLKILESLSNHPDLDLLITGRKNISVKKTKFVFQKFLHHHVTNIVSIKKRLIYRNCLGPLGGVTFSRRVAEKISFKNMASCQDWQMYLEAIDSTKKMISRPDITFNFFLSGKDRISHHPSKKLLGHLQLSHTTASKSIFGGSLRLFYLMTWRRFIKPAQTGGINSFYRRHRISMWFIFLVISLYWRAH